MNFDAYKASLEEWVSRVYSEEVLPAGAACDAGDCAYACDKCRPFEERSTAKSRVRIGCKAQHGCMGYRAVKHIERELPILRYVICDRHKAWWKLEQKKIRKRKAEEAKQRRPPTDGAAPDGWGA